MRKNQHKLVVLRKKNLELIEEISKNKGLTPRINRNTLFFLYPLESERALFLSTVKMKIACEQIDEDKTLNLSEEQKKENKKELKKIEDRLSESIRRLYRIIAIPTRDGVKEIDLGIPTYGETKSLYGEIYEKLRTEGEILESIAPLVIKEKYLVNKDYVLTEQLYQSFFRTPGETRPANRNVLEKSIIQGVSTGLFGLGELEDNKPICRFYKEPCVPALSGQEILIIESLCVKPVPGIKPGKQPEEVREKGDIDSKGKEIIDDKPLHEEKKFIHLRFSVPKGKVSNIMGIMNFLQNKFNSLEVELTAKEGGITKQEFEDKIEEAFRQLGIKIEE